MWLITTHFFMLDISFLYSSATSFPACSIEAIQFFSSCYSWYLELLGYRRSTWFERDILLVPIVCQIASTSRKLRAHIQPGILSPTRSIITPSFVRWICGIQTPWISIPSGVFVIHPCKLVTKTFVQCVRGFVSSRIVTYFPKNIVSILNRYEILFWLYIPIWGNQWVFFFQFPNQ